MKRTTYLLLILFLLSLIPLYLLSESYATYSLCDLDRYPNAFKVSGFVKQAVKQSDGYKIVLCNECCHTFLVDDYVFIGQDVTICGHGYEVKIC